MGFALGDESLLQPELRSKIEDIALALLTGRRPGSGLESGLGSSRRSNESSPVRRPGSGGVMLPVGQR